MPAQATHMYDTQMLCSVHTGRIQLLPDRVCFTSTARTDHVCHVQWPCETQTETHGEVVPVGEGGGNKKPPFPAETVVAAATSTAASIKSKLAPHSAANVSVAAAAAPIRTSVAPRACAASGAGSGWLKTGAPSAPPCPLTAAAVSSCSSMPPSCTARHPKCGMRSHEVQCENSQRHSQRRSSSSIHSHSKSYSHGHVVLWPHLGVQLRRLSGRRAQQASMLAAVLQCSRS